MELPVTLYPYTLAFAFLVVSGALDRMKNQLRRVILLFGWATVILVGWIFWIPTLGTLYSPTTASIGTFLYILISAECVVWSLLQVKPWHVSQRRANPEPTPPLNSVVFNADTDGRFVSPEPPPTPRAVKPRKRHLWEHVMFRLPTRKRSAKKKHITYTYQ